MEHFCYVYTGATRYYLEVLNKLQKRTSRTGSPSLTNSLEPLAHRLQCGQLKSLLWVLLW